MSDAGRRVPLGRIVGVHGVQGAVRLESWTEPRDRIFAYQPWWLVGSDGSTVMLDGVQGRAQGKGLIALLPGVGDRDAAAAWVGSEILIPREALPAPAEGEYYWADLEGLEVVTVAGGVLGRVSHLIATGANDVLVVRDGERERLLPFIPGGCVQNVDLGSGRITVDWDPEF